ncbi:MAG: DUF945 family protein [Cardiobacteriaceae bacterium]|nr:DUF945 family protein [Cardiobacteriaceae bacterium]
MKLNRLALAIVTATALLVSCSDDTKKADKNSSEQVSKLTVAQAADLAESRYREDAIAQVDAVKKMYAANPTLASLKDMNYSISDYQRGENSATAKSTTSFVLANMPLVLESHDTISYNQALLDQNIIARVEHKVDFNVLKNSIQKALDADDDDFSTVGKIIEKIQYHTDILPESNSVDSFEVGSFQQENDGKSIDFKGLKYNVRSNVKTIVDGVHDMDFNLDQITVTDDSKEGGSETIVISPIKGEYSVKEDGNLKLNVSPLQVEMTAADGITKGGFDAIEGSGSSVKFDPTISSYLGDVQYQIKNIHVVHNDKKLNIGDVLGKGGTQKTASGTYDSSSDVTFKLDGASIKSNFPEIPVEPQNLHMQFAVKSLSAQTYIGFLTLMQDIGNQQKQGDMNLSQEAKKRTTTIFKDIVANKTSFSINLDAETDSGKAQFAMASSFRQGEGAATPESWTQAIDAAETDPLGLKNLLKDNLELTAEITIDKSLTDKIKLTELLEKQAGPFVKIENGTYHIKLENNKDGLTVNGTPLPF